MTIRNASIGLAALAAAVLALSFSAEANHEHWFYDSYQAYEYQAYPYGYYRPVQPSPYVRSPWVRPSPRFVPPPVYRAPRRWFPSAAPPRYWFPPTEPPQDLRRSEPPPAGYEARRRAEPPVPRGKPEAPSSEVAARRAATALPAEQDIVTGSLPEVERPTAPPRVEPRRSQPDVAAAGPDPARSGAEQRPARQAAGGISCEAAADIIGGFGFSDIRPTRCEGQVYDFEATRDGQGYSIKLSATDGELTQVRKH